MQLIFKKVIINKFICSFSILILLISYEKVYSQDTIRVCDTINKIEANIQFLETNTSFYQYFYGVLPGFPIHKTVAIYSNGKKFFILNKLNEDAYSLIRFSKEGYPTLVISKPNKTSENFSIILDGTKNYKILNYQEAYRDYYKSYYFPKNNGLIKVRYYSNRGRNVKRYIRKMPKEFYNLLDYILCR